MAKRTSIDFSWDARARAAIAQGALTNSKRPECLVRGVYPSHLARGLGCYVWDAWGNSYIDFICGLGTNLFGYGHPRVTEAAMNAAREGVTLSLSTTLEVELAERLKEFFPWCDRFRFFKTGSEACLAAARIMRAANGYGRKLLLSDGYHGNGEEFVSLSKPAVGCLNRCYIEKLADAAAGNRFDLKLGISNLILEPVITDASDDRQSELRDTVDRARAEGALVAFDEVVTFLRFPDSGSVSKSWGIRPDLIIGSKALGNGFPISFVGGSQDVMECGEWFFSGTYFGDRAAIAAALAVLGEFRAHSGLASFFTASRCFTDQFNAIWPDGVKIEGYGTRGRMVGDEMTRALFFQEACLAGILFGPSVFVSIPHVEHLDRVLNICGDILCRIRRGEVRLLGEMPRSPFSERMRHGN